MSEFSSTWLALREPVDAEARSADLLGALAARRMPTRPLPVVDLGAGTGANLRGSAPLIGGAQDWLLVDSDHSLLEAVPARMRQWAVDSGARFAVDGGDIEVTARTYSCRIRRTALDLATDLDRLPFTEGCLVTGSALLDLVSESWLQRMARFARAANAWLAFALIYDGRMALDPAAGDDEWVRCLFNEHQRTDKGFGPALGPAASAKAIEILGAEGYEIAAAASDWVIDAVRRPLQSALLDGWLGAACERAPRDVERLRRWHDGHLGHVDALAARFTIGHRDIVGWVGD